MTTKAVHITHCGSWFAGSVTHFREKFGDIEGVTITNEPVEVPEGGDKPFDITVNGKLIWSKSTVVDECAEEWRGKPLILESNKWWGEPIPEAIAYVESCLKA